MKNFVFYGKNLYFIISFLFLVLGFFVFFSFKNVIEQQHNEIHNIEISRANKTVKSIMPQIGMHINKCMYNIKDKTIEPKISKILSYYRNEEFKYVYLLCVDDKGAFRYLADGSDLEEKADFYQKFTPSLDKLWTDILTEKKDVYAVQDNAEGLWLTYLSPILEEGKVKGILVLDISTKEYQEFFKVLTPLEKFLNLFLIVLGVTFFIVLLQGFLFYKQYKKSMFDSLTKLYNRHFLQTISKTFFDERLSMMMIDIDFFKKINDNYGHEVGDIVLESIARKLLAATRLEDKVIRYGGEEFLVLVKSAKDKQHVLDIAERIRSNIEKNTIRIDDSLNINITVSIGVNLSVKSFSSMDKAITKADEMLYKAKHNGRNRIEVFED